MSCRFHHLVFGENPNTSYLANRPTRIAEVVQQTPSFVGTCDASLLGMGGVWLPPSSPSLRHPPHPPIVWRVPIPPELRPHLQTPYNPDGTITINDLEMAASLLHADTLASACDIRETTLATGSDNTCAVAWNHRGSVTTTGPAAYLLRLASLHQRHHRYQHVVTYLPGDQNLLADDASRFVTYSDTALLTHFDTAYPQIEPWQLHHPNSETLSSVISALLGKRHVTPFQPAVPPPKTVFGPPRGHPSVTRSSLTPYSQRTKTRSQFFKCSQPASVAAANRSKLTPLLTTYSQLQKRLSHWGPKTRASTPSDPSISASPSN